ncbi:MAG: beta-ketoacyl-[acyl-carrier-protein] synthase family protein [Proteobacteria bacterium]|nr:beta-ketoacyl-[acyl-carrier-protein] synthase family protein [Pseudomonadota bacterium]MCP4915615.1 beta-ketoacyl-[acyl-carrier-protein] synthase family protein [Pseudomonadota bacterium]
MRRVVVTGMGVRSPLGNTPEALFDALLGDNSGVRRFDDWAEIAELGCLVGGKVADFDPKQIPRKYRRSMGRVAMYAVASAVDAVAEAGLTEEHLQGGRLGVTAGSTTGSSGADQQFWEHFISQRSARGIKSTLFFQSMSHTVATNLAMYFNITGEAVSTNAACASSTQAIGTALDRIRAGRADMMLAGGADELHVAAAMTFDAMGGASRGFNDDPGQTPRPFDAGRDGIVVSEGGAILVLEEREHALARGATILAEVLGYAGTSDAVNMASPAPDGMAKAIELALADAGVDASAIDYACAHATGTPIGDEAEAEALHRVLGGDVPVSSLKGHLGHMLGACGGVEAIACILAMQRGVVPFTKNLADPDVAALLLPTAPLERPLSTVLSTNFAFGGVNTALVLRREA